MNLRQQKKSKRFSIHLKKMNEMFKEFDIRKTLILPTFRIRIVFNWRKSKLWGRFGGGWNWQVGVQWTLKTYFFNLLFCTIRISFESKEKLLQKMKGS